MTNLNFRISSALKDIIGRDLITDDNVAIFELVKNSYDAHAERVDVIFNNIHNLEKSKIIIKDNGKGMDYQDLKNKWLFVAYSAKKEGSEDINYRDKIYQKRQFAGAKGIGRFSCDRLGKKLRLETTKNKQETQILYTNWESFEKNMHEEFMEIEVSNTSNSENSYGLKHGTILEISELRSSWNKEKLKSLKDSLAKLINPSSNNKEKPFGIFVTCIEEGIIEEKIENFIFETLEIKTSKIEVNISEDGKTINSELRDGGTLIYKIIEKNIYSQYLRNISVKVFYLNQSAKLTFSHRMGVNTREYGSIFLYKNDVRIYPYGEPGEDPLKLDSRKAQKPSIYIGNKDVIGRIEILGENEEFKETSSRGDGFQKNETYNSFLKFLEDKVIERLEKYVIDVQKWGDGNFLSIEDELDNTSQDELKIKITDLISKLTNNEELIDVIYDSNFLKIINENQSESATSLVRNLFRLAKNTGNNQLLEIATKTEKRVTELHTAYTEANKAAIIASKALIEKESQNLFLKSLRSQDLDEVVSFMHSIGISASTIDNYLSALYQKINRGIPIDLEKLKNIIEVVSFENRKILSISRFATKANFKLYAEDSRLDLVEFIKEYAINILGPLRSEDIKIHIKDNFSKPFILTFKPIELSILLDNLLSNSIRAESKNFTIEFNETQNEEFLIKFVDDGKGISDDNLTKIFDFGYTTTSGSGLGLFHVKDIAKKLNASITVNNKIKKGVEFNFIIK